MKVEQIISFLRQSVFVQDPSGATAQDKQYLSMTDEDLILYLNVAMSRNFSDIPSLEYLPEEDLYPVILLAKKELYYTLAVKEAPLYDMGADNNNYLKRSQRFDHYMALLKQANDEYDDWLENGGEGALGTVTTYYVTLSDRYNTRYNYENGKVPKVTLYAGTITDTSIELWWNVKNISRFYRYKVYFSDKPIIDLYKTEKKYHVSESATLIAEIKDIHQTKVRLTDLNPETSYYVAVQVITMAGLTGYAQLNFTTDTTEDGD